VAKIWDSVALVVLFGIVPILLIGLVLWILPSPRRKKDGTYDFRGTSCFPLNASSKRNTPGRAIISLTESDFICTPTVGKPIRSPIAKLKIVRAPRFKRIWGTEGATIAGLDLLLSDDRTLRILLKSNRARKSLVAKLGDHPMMLTKWMDKELRSRGVEVWDPESP